MWLGSKFTSLSDSLFKTLFRFLFRYDIFISYARSDGKEYALKLRDQLKQLDFSCFLDYDELPPGNSLNNTLKRALRRSAALVVVGTERAVKSRYVELEVGEFAATGRAIIPIDMEGTLKEMPWPVVRERDIVWIDEVQAALTKATPSPAVADSIDKLFKYTRRNSRVRAQVLATIILFVLVVVASLFMIRQQVNAATLASAEAERQTIEARNQKSAADAASADAVEQRRAADAATGRAEAATAEADTARGRATAAEKAAGDAALEAKRQEQKALANAERAKAEQAVAEERTNYVRAQQMGVQADIDIDRGDDLERSVLLSVESLKRAWTPDAYVAWARGMELLPHAEEVKFSGRPDNVSAIAYSPDGRFFAEGAGDAVTFLRRDGTAEPVERHLQSEVMTIAFGKDWVAAASLSEFKMWDLKGFNEIGSSQPNSFDGLSIAFSPDGRYVAVAGPGHKPLLRIFETKTGAMVIDKPIEHVNYLMSVAFSPDGKWLAVACHYDRSGEQSVAEVAGSSLVGRVLIWDVARFAKGAEAALVPATWVDDQASISRATFGPKGDHLATEDTTGGVRMWQVSVEVGHLKLWRQQSELKGGGAIADIGKATLVFSADEKYLMTVTDKNTARVWEVNTGREVSRILHEKPVESVAFSPGGQFATAGGGVSFWKTEFGGVAERLSRDDKPPEADVKALAVTARDEWLVTGGDGGARVYRATDWSPIKTLKEAGRVSNLTVSPDGRWLVASGNGKVTVFETKQWTARKEITSSEQQPFSEPIVGFSPNSRWMVMASGRLVKLFEVGSWREAHTLTVDNEVEEAAFSSDGTWLAALVTGDYLSETHHARKPSSIYIWHTSEGTPAACRNEPQNAGADSAQTPTRWTYAACAKVGGATPEIPLSAVQQWQESPGLNPMSKASPDGRWAVEDNGSTLIFNEGHTSRRVATLMFGADAWTFTADSRWLVVAGNGAVRLWPLDPAGMIDAACARLRRHALTADEWHFTDQWLQPCSIRQP
ncbi:MAG: hypothetical protein QOH49_2359 [Acidobacteriota bacterium]|jgi:WD40 repeat protein|nr:hypothetical protein [Acidobacteriota bacterium]